jgi:hypothetical protein
MAMSNDLEENGNRKLISATKDKNGSPVFHRVFCKFQIQNTQENVIKIQV